MSNGPLVSIIVNNFNYAQFLADAVDSALNQIYPAVEVVIVDDGSTDDSRRVLERYGDRVRSVLKENGGQGSTFNAGFAASQGDIICYLDADDQLCPTAAERFVQLFQEFDPVNVHWPLRVVDETGRPTGEVVPRGALPENGLRERVVREGPLYDWHLTPPTSGNSWARRFLQHVFPMPEAPYRHGADVYLIALAPVYGRMRRVTEPLGSYRAHGGNNYWNRPLDDQRLNNYLERFESASRDLHRHLQAQGVEAEPAEWKQKNFNYLWPQRLLQARQDVRSLIPSGSSYILVDEGEWGSGELIPGRRAIPFLERDGRYWGNPPDDATAIREFERLHAGQASFIVFWWPAFWWLDHYQEFGRYLRERFDCKLDAEHLIAFDLRPRLDSLTSPGRLSRSTEEDSSCSAFVLH
jgi:glycosyltransferase involved in cell wall biosynthesis